MNPPKTLFLFVGAFDEGPHNPKLLRAHSREAAAAWVIRQALNGDDEIRHILQSLRAMQQRSAQIYLQEQGKQRRLKRPAIEHDSSKFPRFFCFFAFFCFRKAPFLEDDEYGHAQWQAEPKAKELAHPDLAPAAAPQAASSKSRVKKGQKKRQEPEQTEDEYLDHILNTLPPAAFLRMLDNSYVDGDSSMQVTLQEMSDPIDV